jgi:MoxR-like ATPase
VDGREFLVPDDVRRLAGPVLAHRLLPVGASAATGEAYAEAAAVLEEILVRTPMPV